MNGLSLCNMIARLEWMNMTPRTRNLYRRRSAFTLLELLTVIALISILLAVLLPVFNKVRKAGREKVCVSNLRQLGLAFSMYMQDNDGQRPVQLDALVTAYLTDPALLICPSDATGNYSYLTWGYRNTPHRVWPHPQSYDYFEPSDKQWSALEARGPSAGYILDRCHGETTWPSAPDRPSHLVGHTLRLNMDGSVVSREIHYPQASTVLDAWYLENFNPGEPVPLTPQ